MEKKATKDDLALGLDAFCEARGIEKLLETTRCSDSCEYGCYSKLKCTGDITNISASVGGFVGGATV